MFSVGTCEESLLQHVLARHLAVWLKEGSRLEMRYSGRRDGHSERFSSGTRVDLHDGAGTMVLLKAWRPVSHSFEGPMMRTIRGLPRFWWTFLTFNTYPHAQGTRAGIVTTQLLLPTSKAGMACSRVRTLPRRCHRCRGHWQRVSVSRGEASTVSSVCDLTAANFRARLLAITITRSGYRVHLRCDGSGRD